jgi:hypothetical protein
MTAELPHIPLSTSVRLKYDSVEPHGTLITGMNGTPQIEPAVEALAPLLGGCAVMKLQFRGSGQDPNLR